MSPAASHVHDPLEGKRVHLIGVLTNVATESAVPLSPVAMRVSASIPPLAPALPQTRSRAWAAA
jgi:hypothetical protein